MDMKELEQQQLEMDLCNGVLYDVKFDLENGIEDFIVVLDRQIDKLVEVQKAMLVCQYADETIAEKALLQLRLLKDALSKTEDTIEAVEDNVQKAEFELMGIIEDEEGDN